MIRVNKLAGLVMFFMLLGSTAVFAQQLPQQEQQTKAVTDTELTKFIAALQGIQMVTEEAQQEMMQVVQSEGMEVERFTEIHQAVLDSEVEVEATSEEKATHKKIVGEFENMQAGVQQQIEKVITDQGLTVEKYEQIAMSIQRDPKLQQRLQQMVQG